MARYTVKELEAILGLTERAVQKHLYEIKDLFPSYQDETGRRKLYFTEEDILEFQERRRYRGRPKKKKVI